jgi:hypothetical protein
MMALRAALAILLVLIALPGFAAPLTPDGPLAVRILYDNSGSMYPGYRPPGYADRQSRAELGARYFHQSPAFAEWLRDFVRSQTIVSASSVGMWALTSNGQFTPGDIRQVHPEVPLRDFDVASALGNFPEPPGDNTYLTESITAFSRDFTGLIWLITDNIVETTAGQPDEGVKRFFQTLNDRDELRSVHLFKYELEDGGRTSTLAVYGILVSASGVPNSTLERYDHQFSKLSAAKRTGGADLFPRQQHLKFKNLRIGTIDLKANLKLVLPNEDNGLFREGQSVELALDGEIRSLLTQHTVTAGRYQLTVDGSFAPEEWAHRDLGAEPLSPEMFESISGAIDKEIPPNGTRGVTARLKSTQPVSFSPSNLLEWLRLAWSGATVRYTGNVRMSFRDVTVRLERRQMAGIFGIDQASSVFDFQDVSTLPEVQPSVAPASFALRTDNQRTVILLVALALLLAAGIVAVYGATRKQTFEVAISGKPKTTIALRRMGTHPVKLDAKLLGRLSRGLVGGYAFDPVRDTAMSIVPSGDDMWNVHFIGGSTYKLSIKAEEGAAPKQQKAAPAGGPRVPPAPPPPPSRNVPPPPRPPMVKR